MNSVRNWMDSIEQAAIDDYGYRADEATKFSGDVFNDTIEDVLDLEEPDLTDLDD